MEKQNNSLPIKQINQIKAESAVEEAHWPADYPEDIKEMIRAAMKELELRGLM